MQLTRLCAQQEALHQYLDSLLAEIPSLDEETQASGSIVPDVAPVHVAEDLSDPAPVVDGAVPAWGRQPFKALLFELGGMRLAAPLFLLSGVAAHSRLTQLPGLPKWCHGVLIRHGRQVLIVDTATIVSRVAEDQEERLASAVHVARQYVLVGEERYGLACDAVLKVIDVDPQGVRWRRGKGRRPWYGGIISDSMCALLDVDELCAMLEAEETIKENYA
ncbi:MAG: chemotaxis protein CheW [Gammaproteobacteria bacterium]